MEVYEIIWNYIWLVVLTILKSMSSSMGRMTSIYEMENKKMFETTNQFWIYIYIHTYVVKNI